MLSRLKTIENVTKQITIAAMMKGFMVPWSVILGTDHSAYRFVSIQLRLHPFASLLLVSQGARAKAGVKRLVVLID